ncbi:MAG: phage tail protein [Methylococcaceae bacterium]|nr:phage tail protein [Methylococcaceae bacterium]
MPIPVPAGEDPSLPFPGFAFHVHFAPVDPNGGAGGGGTGGFPPFDGVAPEIAGGFSEVSGLEASMEAKVIKVGGRNYGPVQRAGPVSFATVVLKRGIIQSRYLWNWWALFAGANGAANGGWAAANRCDVFIALMRESTAVTGGKPVRERKAVIGWKLENAMPIKFRVGDLNARGTDILIEELHLVHEGLHTKGVV